MKTLPQLRTEAILTRARIVNDLENAGYTGQTDGVSLIDLVAELETIYGVISGEIPVIDSAYDYYNNYTGNEFIISNFIATSATTYETEQEAEIALQSMYDAGINYPLIDHGFDANASGEIIGMGKMGWILDAAQRMGRKVLVNTHYCQSIDTEERAATLTPLIRDIIDNSYQHPACAGWYMGDEPKVASWARIYAIQKDYRDNVFDSERNYIMANMLLPSYGMYQEAAYGADQKFGEYLEDFQVAFGGNPDYVSTNHYVWINGWDQASGWASKTDKRCLYIGEMSALRATCGENKTMSVIQIANIWQGTNGVVVLEHSNLCTEHIRWASHIAIAFGISSIWGYVYHSTNYPGGKSWYYNTNTSQWEYGLVGYSEACADYLGRRTKVYDMCQDVFMGIHKMKGVFLDYRQSGIIEHGVTIPTQFDRSGEYQNYGYLADLRRELPVGGLSSISGESPLLIGLFTKEGGDTGFHVVNLNSEPQSSNGIYPAVELTLDAVRPYRVWSSDGLIQMVSGEVISLSLAPGEGQFIEVVGGVPVDPDTENKISSNSTFYNDEGWTFSAADFSTQYHYLIPTAKTHTLSPVSRTITLVKGARYRLSYMILNGVNGHLTNTFIRCSVGGVPLITYHHNTNANTTIYTDYFIAPDTSCLLQFLFSNTLANPSWFGITNLSITAA